jgi:thiamine biosynthesis lipoprotein
MVNSSSLLRVFVCTLLLLPCLHSGVVNAEWHQQQRDIMGTRISVELWHKDPALAKLCSDLVFVEMNRIDALMSSYIDSSELSYINKNAATIAVKLSDEMRKLISKSLYFSDLSNGVFDITYASIGYAYDYRQSLQPSAQAIEQKLPSIDYHHVELANNKVRFADNGVRIDLGGIAKGYAVDQAIDIISACGIREAMISAGGDSRIIGDRRGRSWIIGIQHPRDPEDIALRLPLSDSAISTSGDYERFFIENGQRVHHIINPDTGRSANASWSATVTGPDAMTTDALSTTIFIMGAVKGIALIENLDGIDAIVIDNNGKVHYSSGFQPPEAEGQ